MLKQQLEERWKKLSEKIENLDYQKISQNWLFEAGLIKQLQLLVVISLFINFGLLFQVYDLNKINKYLLMYKPKYNLVLTGKEFQLKTDNINFDLDQFSKRYLGAFFETSVENFNFIQKNTKKEFFNTSVKKQLESRAAAQLASSFRIESLFSEPIGELYKVIVFGREEFQDEKYQSRNLVLELIFDPATKKIINIPVFELNKS